MGVHAQLPEDLVGEFGITLSLGDGPAGEVLARRISEAAGISVRVVGRAPAGSEKSEAEGDDGAGREWLAGFTDAYSSEGGLWSGPLDELLDAWVEAEGYSWRYGAETRTVEIVRSETRVFGVNALVGDMQHQVSTQTSGSGGDSTTGGSQQSITASMNYAPWREIAEQASAAAGEEASVSVSEAAGTVTVSGLPRAVERVRRLLVHLNATILRPLTLSVHLYSVRVGRGSNMSLGLSGALPDVLGTAVEVGAGGIGIVRPSTADGTSLLATVNALRSIGTATRVLSVDIPGMHGMPVQFYDLLDEAYLEEIKVTVSEGVREVSLTPGTVTSGFGLSYVARIIAPHEVLARITATIQDRPEFAVFGAGGEQIQLPVGGRRAIVATQRIGRGETLLLTGFTDRASTATKEGTFDPDIPLPDGRRNADEGRVEMALLVTAQIGEALGISETSFAEGFAGAGSRAGADIRTVRDAGDAAAAGGAERGAGG